MAGGAQVCIRFVMPGVEVQRDSAMHEARCEERGLQCDGGNNSVLAASPTTTHNVSTDRPAVVRRRSGRLWEHPAGRPSPPKV